jgi:hypothetical protein
MHQLGLSGDPAKNFTLSVPAAPDGTMKLARGNAGATVQDIITVAADGKVALPQLPTTKTAAQVSGEMPNGVIVKGGTIGSVSAGGALAVSFATSFPNACVGVSLTQVTAGVVTTLVPFSAEDITAAGFIVRNNWNAGGITGRYVAIGY